MEMIDCLPSIVPGIDHKPVAIAKSRFARNARSIRDKLPQQRAVRLLGMRCGGNVLFRDDKQMNGRLWMNVRKGETHIVFIYALRRDGTCDDVAKKTICAHVMPLIHFTGNVSRTMRDASGLKILWLRSSRPRIVCFRKCGPKEERRVSIEPPVKNWALSRVIQRIASENIKGLPSNILRGSDDAMNGLLTIDIRIMFHGAAKSIGNRLSQC